MMHDHVAVAKQHLSDLNLIACEYDAEVYEEIAEHLLALYRLFDPELETVTTLDDVIGERDGYDG
jgi:hypothetical protein